MADSKLVDRLAALPNLDRIPRNELEWLADHGTFRVLDPGEIIAHKGKRIEYLWLIFSGHIVVNVDRGTGPRRVTEWHPGDVSGMLPYSRMTGPPGDNFAEVKSELFGIHESHFPEMIHLCPIFTAYTVHSMLDRARSFSASDLQDEKLVSLGKLSAGLAHELNNPASAALRNAKLLLSSLASTDAASRALGAASLNGEMLETIDRVRSVCLAKPTGNLLSPLEQADREDEITNWLEEHNVDPSLAPALGATPVTIAELDTLARAVSSETLGVVLQWIAAGCSTRTLAADIEQAATRISELVSAVKRFTYMDNLASSELVDVAAGLRDTIRIVASKAKTKGAAVTLDAAPDLPRVRATGGELNQVWLNLLDNALDAIPNGGRIQVSARAERNRLVVRIADNGPGIPADVQGKVFEPFFTTKPPGHGTGLGLDLTRRILRRYHAEIAVQSQPGHTEFRVSLAAAMAPTVEGEEPAT